jgi:SAM-dependent methyltransferase
MMRPTTTGDALDLLDASVTSAALGVALELGLFWILDERPRSVADVADTLGIPRGRCRYWLQLLAQAGLVEEAAGLVRPSAAARTAILGAFTPETWAFLALESRERYPVGVDLARTIRGGSAVAAETQGERHYLTLMSTDPDRARRFTRMLYELHRPLAADLAARFDMTNVSRLLDVGGGSGVVSHAFARRYPRLSAVVVDIENVCDAGREIAAENGLEDRVSHHAADFSSGDLPRGFDFAIMCDVGIYPVGLFHRVHAALGDGGRFAIVDDFAPAPGLAPRSRATWALARSLVDPGYQVPTADDVARMLEAADFRLLRREALRVAGERDPLTILEATRLP